VGKLRVSREAQAELDNIWLYTARESGSIDVATRITDSITRQFWLLSRYPNVGRRRDELRPGLRSFAAGDYHRLSCGEGCSAHCAGLSRQS